MKTARVACMFGSCVAIALAACQSVPTPAAPKDQTFAPLAPNTLGADRRARQVLRAAFGGREATLSTVVEVRGDELRVIGTTAIGQRVFAVHQRGTQIDVESQNPLANQVPPRQLLSDLQLAYWPLEVLRGALGDGWQVKQATPDTRRLYRDDKLVAEVHYRDADPWNGRFWLVNFVFDYSLSIESQLVQ